MTSLLTIVVLVIIAFSGAYIFQKLQTKNTFIKSLAFTGILYISLGFVLGPEGLNVFKESVLNHLNIIFALVLGWVGFLIGLQTKLSGLRRFPFKYYRYSSLNFIIVFIATFFLIKTVLEKLFAQNLDVHSLMVLSLAGAVSSPIMLAVVIRDHRVHARLAHLLQFQAAYDNLLGVFSIGLVVLVVALLGAKTGKQIVFHGFIVLTVSIVSGIMFYFLTKEKRNEEERFLFIVGLLMFVVGAALYFGMSVLLAALIFGVLVANTSKETRNLYHNVQQVEKPMYVLLLIFTGVNISLLVNLYMLIAFFVVHILSKLGAEYLANYSLGKQERHTGWLGFGNIGMGGLSLAIILDYYLVHPVQSGEGLLLIVIITLLLQDGIALNYLEKRLITKR